MCHELQSTYKCSCVIVRPTFCSDSIKRTLCDVVSIEQKHLSLKCSRCRQRALEKLKNLAAAAPVKQNLAIANATALLPTSNNKRKATPEQEQERPTTKKPKTQTQAEAKVEREKRLEYQRKYRQAQAAKKRAAEREKVEAQRQREDEELEEGILAAFEEIE